MKKITVFMLSFLMVCSFLTACKEEKEEKKVDSFLSGKIWEAVLKPSDTTSDVEGHVIAYKLNEDGTFLFYQNVNESLYITAGGYYEPDEENKKLVLSNEADTESFEFTYEYNEDTGILTLSGPVAYFLDGKNQDVQLNFAKVSEENLNQYKEDATISYQFEKQTSED